MLVPTDPRFRCSSAGHGDNRDAGREDDGNDDAHNSAPAHVLLVAVAHTNINPSRSGGGEEANDSRDHNQHGLEPATATAASVGGV